MTGHYLTKKTSPCKANTISELSACSVVGVSQVLWTVKLIESLNQHSALANDYDTAIKLLENERFDGILISSKNIQLYKNAGALREENIWVSPAVIDLSVYGVLAMKHKALMPVFEEKVRETLGRAEANRK